VAASTSALARALDFKQAFSPCQIHFVTAATRRLFRGTSPSPGKQFGGAYLNSGDDNPSTLWSSNAVFMAPLPLLQTDALCGPPSACTRSSRLYDITNALTVVERFDVFAVIQSMDLCVFPVFLEDLFVKGCLSLNIIMVVKKTRGNNKRRLRPRSRCAAAVPNFPSESMATRLHND
jgi:hypothetical protein